MLFAASHAMYYNRYGPYGPCGAGLWLLGAGGAGGGGRQHAIGVPRSERSGLQWGVAGGCCAGRAGPRLAGARARGSRGPRLVGSWCRERKP